MKGKEIVFRVDASMEIGSGHVMRCLSLADALDANGANCRFICRKYPGNLIELIEKRGYAVLAMPNENIDLLLGSTDSEKGGLEHSHWLGDWRTDARQTIESLKSEIVDWLVIDHYGIDSRWESEVHANYKHLMVIDDLADRDHICEILLDQNFIDGMAERYVGRVPKNCACLIGPEFALVRPEFNIMRASSLAHRKNPALNRLLVFMGGSDPENETAKVIEGIKLAKRKWQHVDVVVGQAYPFLDNLKANIIDLGNITLHVQVSNMATLMAEADFSITAGGSVTWEKCTVGLPSFVVIVSANQIPIATSMHACGAQRTLGISSEMTSGYYASNLDALVIEEINSMIVSASKLCDGTGIKTIVEILEVGL